MLKGDSVSGTYVLAKNLNFLLEVDLVILYVILKSHDKPLNEIPDSEYDRMDETALIFYYDVTRNQWDYPNTTGDKPCHLSGTQFNAVVIFHDILLTAQSQYSRFTSNYATKSCWGYQMPTLLQAI